MDPNNPISSNPGQFDVNAAFIKQQQQQQQQLLTDLQHVDDFDADFNPAIYGTARNGKHQDNDDDYDYSDLGPETDVDAIEDVDSNIGHLNTSSSSRELLIEKSEKIVKNEEFISDVSNNDKNDNNDDSDLNRDNANVCPVDPLVDVDNRVRPSDKDVRDADNEAPRDNDDGDARVESAGTQSTVVDDDESPPSPRATKPLQHALIPEAENVADSEDSEDEWNYYRVDPNKEEESAAAAVAAGVEELSVQEKNTESIEKGSSEFQSPEIADDIKCEKLEKEIPTSDQLVNIDISDKEKPSGEAESVKDLISIEDQEQINTGDMDFQLNPEAAEFVPLSSPLMSNRNFLQDYPISGSPLKQTPAMDDIPVPSQSEFEQEVCQRPREIDEKDSVSEEQQANNDQQANNLDQLDLDVSDISSTRVEVGDESTTQWQAEISSQWTEKTRDDTKLNPEEYDIVDKNDPMMMSFEPDECAAAFKKDLDLNAVHDLSDSSESEECKVRSENGEESDGSEPDRPSRSPIPLTSAERVHTPFSDDKDTIDLLCTSSTPQPPDAKEVRIASSEVKDILFTTENTEIESSSTDDNQTGNTSQSLELSPVISETQSDSNSSKNSSNDHRISQHEDYIASEDSRASSVNLFNKIIDPCSNTHDGDVQEIMDNYKILKNFIKKDEKSNDYNEYLEKANALLEKENRLHESEQKTSSDETSSLDDSFLKAQQKKLETEEGKEELESLHSNTEIEQLHVQNNIATLTKAEHHEFVHIEQGESAAKLQQLVDSMASPYPNEMMLCTEDIISCHADDSAKTSDQAKKVDDDIDKDKKDIDKDDEENIDPDSTTKLLNPFTDLDYVSYEHTIVKSEQPAPWALRFDESDESTKETENLPIKQEQIEKEITEVVAPKVASEDIPAEKETVSQKIAEAPLEDIAKVDESKKDIIAGAATAAAAVVVTAATAVTVCSTKSKATSSTTAKRPTMKSTTTKAAPATKTATKSMPTSPSKAVSTTVRATTTAQSAAAKKPPAARPKQLDGTTRVSSTSGKITARPTTTTTAAAATMASKTTTSLTKISPRLSAGTTKPKTTTATTAASSKSSAGATAEKKSTSGDAKSAGKTAAAKPASAAARTSSGAIAKTTLVKTSSTTTKTSLSAVTSKPRPASAKTSISPSKQLSTNINGTTTGATTRPRTAPSSAGTLKSRENVGKAMTAKSPLIDKQSKETVNKQISRSGVSPSPRTIGRVSGTPTTNAKTRTSIGKSPGNASATSPTKKSTLTSKISAGTKNALTSGTKVLQNGISEIKETLTEAVVITKDIINDKLEDDVPRRDASPVNVPTDNQLIAN